LKNRKYFSEQVVRLENGLTKLKEAAVQVAELDAELRIKQVEVDGEKVEVETLIADIKQKTEIASKH